MSLYNLIKTWSRYILLFAYIMKNRVETPACCPLTTTCVARHVHVCACKCIHTTNKSENRPYDRVTEEDTLASISVLQICLHRLSSIFIGSFSLLLVWRGICVWCHNDPIYLARESLSSDAILLTSTGH